MISSFGAVAAYRQEMMFTSFNHYIKTHRQNDNCLENDKR